MTHSPPPYPLAVGSATASAADALAGVLDITTGARAITRLVSCTILRSGTLVSEGAAATLNYHATAGLVRIANGSTYTVTAGDLVTVAVTEQPLA